jgi:hypothetical protein
MHQPRSSMNTALWTMQVLWGVFFSVTGFGKVLCYKPAFRAFMSESDEIIGRFRTMSKTVP